MAKRKLLVTGASGILGRRVVELLLEAKTGDELVALTRKPEKLADLAAKGITVLAGDFEAPESLVKAFAGVDRLLLVSTDALDRPGRRLAQHQAAIDAAVKSKVKHVVYTSIPNPTEDSPIATTSTPTSSCSRCRARSRVASTSPPGAPARRRMSRARTAPALPPRCCARTGRTR